MRVPRGWQGNDEAASSLLALLMATTFVAVGFGSITYAAVTTAPTQDESSAAAVAINADLLALDLVEVPGGILDLSVGGVVDPGALESLQDAPQETYDGLADQLGYDFHIRLWPLLPNAEATMAAGGDDRLNVLYVAHHERTARNPHAPATPSPEAQREIAYLEALVAGFSSEHVLADDADLDARLRASLSDADVLVVGSHADLDRLRPAQGVLRAWIEDGGALVVLGSDAEERTIQQLMPRVRTTANGGLADPDDDHPALFAPNVLEHPQLPSGVSAAGAADASAFARVLASDQLLVSHPSAHGEGRIVITSWLPGHDADAACDPHALTADCQGLRALHNLLSFGYTDLHLDFGAFNPDDGRLDTARRLMSIDHPRWGPVQLALLVVAQSPEAN